MKEFQGRQENSLIEKKLYLELKVTLSLGFNKLRKAIQNYLSILCSRLIIKNGL